jgi:hypothetical protein
VPTADRIHRPLADPDRGLPVIYVIDDDHLVVLPWRVAHRSSAYDDLDHL